MARDVLSRLRETGLVAIAVNGDAWPRALLAETVIPDAWMGLVETRDGRRRFVPAGEDPRPDRDDRLLLVRNRPITVPVAAGDCAASCGNEVSAAGELLVRWQARDDDLAALRRSLMDADELTLAELAQRFTDAGVSAAIQAYIRGREAGTLIGADHRDALAAALREALRRFLFDAGLTLERVAKLQLASRSLIERQAAQRDAAQRVERIQAAQMVEQAALAATRRRLDDLGGILEKLKTAAAHDSRLQWHDLLPALSPAERGRLLANLWRITPDRTVAQAIVAVAADECAWIDPARTEQFIRRVRPPDELGGLRSATFDRSGRRLLVGAATGVWALSADDGRVLARFSAAAATRPRTGFNAATILGDRLFATHSTLGCLSWALDAPDAPRPVLVPSGGSPRAIRAVTLAPGDCVLFSADDCVHRYNPQTGELLVLGSADDVVHSIAVSENDVFVGTAGGNLLRFDLRQPEDWWRPFRTSEPIEAISVRRMGDLIEAVAPAGAQGVVGVYGDDGVVARLVESPVPIRRAWACDDLIVGLNDNRDRLVIASSNTPDRGCVQVPIARLLGDLVQDVCVVTV